MNRSIDQRLVEVESLLVMLQRDFEAQNEMILVYARQLQQVEKLMERLVSELEGLKSAGGPEDPEPEVPPHY